MTTNGASTNGIHPNGTSILMELCLSITDQDLYDELNGYPEGAERDKFALSALKIGCIALQQAQGRIDAERVRQEGEHLISMMGQALAQHQQEVTGKIGDSLKIYFDPESGQFDKRVKALVGQDGELERAIRKQVEGSDSSLAQTLTAQVGQNSPLMQVLDVNAKDGLLSQIRQSTDATLSAQREQILSEFSKDNPESAINRLIAELTKNHGDVGKALEERIDKVTGEFSLDRDDSALSRLFGRVETAQRQISSEFDLNQDNSALAQMQKKLLEVIESQRQTNEQFQRDVIEKLGNMIGQKRESEKGTHQGLEFEDAVFEHIDSWCQKSCDTATHTGNITGVSNSKVGDAVIELGPDNVAAGAKIVVEAKKSLSYTFNNALAELKKARDNRDAGVGLFVFSGKSAPGSLEPFTRIGNDIVVIWDTEDSASDVIFDAGLSVAKALSVRAKTYSDEVGADFVTIENAIHEIESHASELNQIKTWVTTIKNNSENVLNRVEKMRDGMTTQISILNEKVGGLREAVGSES